MPQGRLNLNACQFGRGVHGSLTHVRQDTRAASVHSMQSSQGIGVPFVKAIYGLAQKPQLTESADRRVEKVQRYQQDLFKKTWKLG